MATGKFTGSGCILAIGTKNQEFTLTSVLMKSKAMMKGRQAAKA
jgi:hypothetical protein